MKNMSVDLKPSLKYYLDIYYGRRHPKPEKLTEVPLCAELSRAIGGATEVNTPVGRIDLLRDDLIIETKIPKLWKQGLGQLFCYELFYKRANKGLGIIGEMPKMCPPVCEELGVLLFHYSFNEYRWRVW